ncbi:MAG TPA: tetratricopeptide repeat protein [Methylomirabilota bacterium]
MALLGKLIGLNRSLTSVELFRRADQNRREGRVERATEFVRQGLALEPNSLLGRLLAAYLYVAGRKMAAAKAEFERVLAREADHPRALLGLARIAFEEGDAARCTELLARALERYPDFPEATALMEATTAHALTPAPSVEARTFRQDRLRPPAGTRDLLLLQNDGTVLWSHPEQQARDELAAHLLRLARIASSTLARSGYGPLRRAILDGAGETTFIRANDTLLLSLTHPPGADTRNGLLEMNTLWAASLQELGMAT